MKKLILFLILIASPCFAFDFNGLEQIVPSKDIMKTERGIDILFHPNQFAQIQEAMIQKYGIPRVIKGNVNGLPMTKCEWKQGEYRISIQTVHDGRYKGVVKAEKAGR